MKILDLVRLILGNLSRRKARVALTAIGVVIGTAAVVILVSLAIGLQRNANEQLYGIGDLTQIQVMPAYDMEGGPGMVVRVGGGGGGPGEPQAARLLTNSALEELRAIPGVESVIPREYLMTGVLVKYQKLEGGVNVIGVDTADLASLGLETVEGGTELGRNTVVIGAMVPNNFYDPRIRPGQEPPPPPQLYGQQIQVTVMKWDSEGNEIRKNLSLRACESVGFSRKRAASQTGPFTSRSTRSRC
jgi:putative ABC transport system permease protein